VGGGFAGAAMVQVSNHRAFLYPPLFSTVTVNKLWRHRGNGEVSESRT